MRGPSAEWDLDSDLFPAVRRTAAIVAAARHTADADKGDIGDRFRLLGTSGSLQKCPSSYGLEVSLQKKEFVEYIHPTYLRVALLASLSISTAVDLLEHMSGSVSGFLVMLTE